MSIWVRCPHGTADCQESDHNRGVLVLCGSCRRSFSVRGLLAAPPGSHAMGATAAVLLVWDGLALVGRVGDCRV